MDVQKGLSVLTTILLKLGVIVFLIPFLLDFWNNPGTEDEFWYWFIKIGALVLFIALTLLVLFFNRIRFYYFGFSIVLIISIYMLIDLAFKYNFHPDQAIYFLLITISFYFMSKKERKQKKRF